MAHHSKDNDLIDEQQALSMFFTSLLNDAEPGMTLQQASDLPSETKNVQETSIQKNTVFLPEISTESNTQLIAEDEGQCSELSGPTERISDVEPDRKSGDFQIMMFKTAGLTLAVPLVELSGVIPWTNNITEMPGHSTSYLGIVQHLDKKVPIIDIAQIVFPQDRLDDLVSSHPQEKLKRIVFIDDFKWGLACDAVNDVITIDAEQIKWRKSTAKRSWLAGTVVEHMCALLNTTELSKLLRLNQL